jgi:O-antigen ligase
MAAIALGQRDARERDATLAVAVAMASLLLVAALLAGGPVAIAGIAGALFCLAAVYRPDIGLCGAAVLAFSVPALGGEPQLNGALRPALQPVPGVGLLPLELIVLSCVLGVLARRVFVSSYHLRFGALMAPLVVLTLLLALGVGYGLSQGGNSTAALWETRGVFLLLPLYFIAVNVVRTKENLRMVCVVLGGALLVACLETLYRHFTYIRGSYSFDVNIDLVFAHEVAIFAAALAFYLLAQSLWSRSPWRTVACGALALVPLAALIVTHRRAGMVALDASLILLALALLRTDVRRFLVLMPLAIIVIAGLLAATWHEPGGLGQPARGIQTIIGTNERDDDISSDEYREREEANVRANIMARPLQGLGFGREYEFPNGLPDLSSFWPMYRYLPHNSILWIWVKGGVLAFVTLIALFAMAMTRSAQLFTTLAEPVTRTIALTAGAWVLMFVVFAYTDLGLVTSASVFFFGITLGVIGALGWFPRITPAPAQGASNA